MMKFTEKQIEEMEERGGNRWTKKEHDRLYIKPEFIGMEIWYTKSTGFKNCQLPGESKNYSSKIAQALDRAYIDLHTGDIYVNDWSSKSGAAAKLVQDVVDEIVEKFPGTPEQTQEPEIVYTTLRVPYGFVKDTFYKRIRDSYDGDTKTIEIRVEAEEEAKVRKAVAAYEQEMEAEKREKEAAQKEREKRRVTVKYKDLKEKRLPGRIEKTVSDSYNSKDHTIQVYAKTMEDKEKIEAYYGKLAEKRAAVPEEVWEFKNGEIDEYTLEPKIINPDDIDNAVPEKLINNNH